MPTTTIRVTQETQSTIRELAEVYGVSMQEVVDKAVKTLSRQQFFNELDEAYAALEADPQAWEAWEEEISSLDNTLNDGLEGL